MRDSFCTLLSVLLFCFVVFIGSVPSYEAAWWGLLCPDLFSQPLPGEEVTFIWPIFDSLITFLRLHA